MPLTAERLSELLHYDPETGVFVWTTTLSNRAVAGQIAGSRTHGYVIITIGRRHYRAHRLAWLYVYGQWPDTELDHIDGNGLNNRMDNLREATHAQNSLNRKGHRDNQSGFKGVTWHTQRRRWNARIFTRGKSRSLGLFDTPAEAHAAYCTAADKYHGEFARTTS